MRYTVDFVVDKKDNEWEAKFTNSRSWPTTWPKDGWDKNATIKPTPGDCMDFGGRIDDPVWVKVNGEFVWRNPKTYGL